MKGRNFDGVLTGALVLLFLCCGPASDAFAGPGDFNIDGTFEAALDLPRILFLLKENPNGPPLLYEGSFETNWAFLDTGASGILLSRETCDDLGISIDPNGLYADVGVGGAEFFDISQELYIATDDFSDEDPYNLSHYHFLTGPWRFQVKQTYADEEMFEEPIDLLGMPVMAGKTVVLNAEGPSLLDYFSAVIKDPNDPTIPPVDFNVPLRFEKFVMPNDPLNIPPLPVLAYNPVIDGITAEYSGSSTTGTWLFDTGGTISLMSGAQAAALGLTDANGTPIVEPDFLIPIGGIGDDVNVPGYEIDNLAVPTLNGYNLVFNNARIGVLNIGIIDDETGEFIILDGVFGSNFLTASAKLEDGWPVDLAEGAFKTIVIDMQKGLLGFDANDLYALPSCGDAEHPRPTADITGDCRVNLADLDILNQNWLNSNCGAANNFCQGADLYRDGKVDFVDFSFLTAQWLNTPFLTPCGSADRPWRQGDFNHDCEIDLDDLRILADEWLNTCNWLNWNCRGADLIPPARVNFTDFANFAIEN